MPFRLGLPELLILLVIILILFSGRISKVASEIVKSIKAFRKGVSENEENQNSDEKHPF